MRTIGTASRVLGVFLACGSVVAALAWAAPPAQAFSTGPHFDLSTDVLLREGVPATVTMRTIRVANYQVDGFGSARDVITDTDTFPIHSFWDTLYPAPARDVTEQWMHFGSKTEVQPTYERLVKNSYKAMKQAEAQNDTVGLLVVLGASMHWLQDFYAHTNWAEKSEANGWADSTWFDIPDSVKQTAGLSYLSHDDYNKDAPDSTVLGSPYYPRAYRQAFYASWQWVKLARQWVSPSFWNQAMAQACPVSGSRNPSRAIFPGTQASGRAVPAAPKRIWRS